MLTSSDSTGSAADDAAFIHERVIDAPRAAVYAAFSDPARLTRWWGPDGFSSTFAAFDLRNDGRWTFVLHGPDGRDYPNEMRFVEVVPGTRVVLEHLVGHHFILAITFADHAGGTLVGWRQEFDTVEERERIAPIVMPANEQNLDRLTVEVRRVG